MRKIEVDEGDIFHLEYEGQHAQLEIISVERDIINFRLGEYDYSVGFKVPSCPREINFEWMGIRVIAIAGLNNTFEGGKGFFCFDAHYLTGYRYEAARLR